MGVRTALTSLAMSCALLVSCTQQAPPTDGVSAGVPDSLQVTSAAFADGDRLPVRFTCDGEGTPPPLAWTVGTEPPAAWALVVDDPDAPGGTFVHWVVLDLPARQHELGAAALPAGAVQARTSAGDTGYTPACPPQGAHRYRFTVYALDRPTGLSGDVGLDEALRAVAARATARGVLVATYERP